jgi:SAM-dependent methyltransferase
MELEEIKKRVLGSKDESLKKHFMQDMMTDDFMDALHDINFHGSKDVQKLVSLAKGIEHLNGWPEDQEKFWDIEAPFWKRRVDASLKEIIFGEIAKTISGRVLNIGSGTVPYINSINADISFEMLNWNPSKKKVQADALALPFKDKTFDSVIAVFVANYIKDLENFIRELKRVSKKDSTILFVQGKSIQILHQLAENKSFSLNSLISLLREYGFTARVIEKEKLIFLRCKNLN